MGSFALADPLEDLRSKKGVEAREDETLRPVHMLRIHRTENPESKFQGNSSWDLGIPPLIEDNPTKVIEDNPRGVRGYCKGWEMVRGLSCISPSPQDQRRHERDVLSLLSVS